MGESITSKLTSLLARNGGSPFLFVGSGFSRRYIGLEQWNELLARFCEEIKSFGYYSTQNNKNLPKAASEMAKDFNEVWWNSEKYSESRKINSEKMESVSSALKFEISKYLANISHAKLTADGLGQELEALSRINVDGIITTNWDLFIEELFPDYKVFVGQEELLFSNPQSIGEIYKIHGCSSQPNSLVLTNEDYEVFEGKNPYLAAKLITIFIEHPVIFIGYSLTDRNIQKIIESIVNCLGQDKLDLFGRNLIFLQRTKAGEEPSFQPALMSVGDTRLNITVIQTNNFLDAYQAIESTKRKIPARVLRYCKEQMYELVKSNNPETKLAVLDIDQLENKDDVEFVVGVGIAKEYEGIAKQGYKGVTIDDIFKDILSDQSSYDAAELFREAYPQILKRPNKYIPGFRYLNAQGIDTYKKLMESEFSNLEGMFFKASREDYQHRQYKKHYEANYSSFSTRQIISETPAEKAALIIPFQKDENIDVAAVKEFINNNKESLKTEHSSYSTYFRKLVCLVDRLEFGFNKA